MMMECRASFTFLSLFKSGAIDLEALTVFAPPSWSAIAALDGVGRRYRWPVLFGVYTTLALYIRVLSQAARSYI
jgi:hypothetical protein